MSSRSQSSKWNLSPLMLYYLVVMIHQEFCKAKLFLDNYWVVTVDGQERVLRATTNTPQLSRIGEKLRNSSRSMVPWIFLMTARRALWSSTWLKLGLGTNEIPRRYKARSTLFHNEKTYFEILMVFNKLLTFLTTTSKTLWNVNSQYLHI